MSQCPGDPGVRRWQGSLSTLPAGLGPGARCRHLQGGPRMGLWCPCPSKPKFGPSRGLWASPAALGAPSYSLSRHHRSWGCPEKDQPSSGGSGGQEGVGASPGSPHEPPLSPPQANTGPSWCLLHALHTALTPRCPCAPTSVSCSPGRTGSASAQPPALSTDQALRAPSPTGPTARDVATLLTGPLTKPGRS